jgi:hypothetical protein
MQVPVLGVVIVFTLLGAAAGILVAPYPMRIMYELGLGEYVVLLTGFASMVCGAWLAARISARKFGFNPKGRGSQTRRNDPPD